MGYGHNKYHMSLQFSDTTTDKGIIQVIEDELGFDRGHITGNTARLKRFTALVNLAWDEYFDIAIRSSGTWQADDSNHTDYPIIKADIVAGQQSYTFLTDENGNLVLDIYKVLILPSATATEYVELDPIDQQQRNAGESITSESTSQGVPSEYDKTANGFFFDVPPSYSVTNGIKVLINREPSYFTTSDTTKKPGCPGLHHRYFALRPALDYARVNNHDNFNNLAREVLKYEGDETQGLIGKIERHFARRKKDESAVIRHKKINYI